MESPHSILCIHRLHAKKKLGQNFLKKNNIANFIIKRENITDLDYVLEIGPGLGALTLPIAKVAKKVIAIEKDPEIAQILLKKLEDCKIKNVDLIIKDFLDLDFNVLCKKNNKKFILLGNIPYNLSSKIIVKLIKNRSYFSKVIIMLQKEVAERVCAEASSKKYGRISIFSQYYSNVSLILNVKASSFFPRPSVASALVNFSFLDKPKFVVKDEIFFFRLIKAAFSKRRKTLKNSLIKSSLGLNSEIYRMILDEINIISSKRAEELSIQDFVNLVNFFTYFSR